MQYDILSQKAVLEKTIENIKSRGINVILCNSKEEALQKVIELIPKDSAVCNGGSTTLGEIGFVDFLKSKKHKWKNLHEEILKETEPSKQLDLRRMSTTADYFLGSVNAICQTGELISCDASGSRVGAYLFSAKKLILISGTQKIVPTLVEGFARVREYVFPLENEHSKKAYGMESTTGKWAIIEREIFQDRTTLILINEKLGF